MTISRTDRNQRFDGQGNLISETVVQVDVTADVVTLDLHAKGRAFLTAAQTFLALPSPTNAQVLAMTKANTRAIAALVRLSVGADLLDDTATDT